MSNSDFPKTIWMLWFQGEEKAPFIVKQCIDSWRRENPDWNLIVLDEKTMYDYISIELPPEKLEAMPRPKKANLVRLLLLEQLGGVWADATLYCMLPLNDWIYDHMEAGFFVFERPGPDRLMSNWMIVSKKNNRLCSELRKQYQAFFSENSFKLDSKIRNAISRRCGRILNKSTKTTKYWFHPFFTKVLRVYPYLIFHYIFERLIANDEECRKVWEKMPKVSAIPPHNVKRAGELGMLSPLSDELKAQIDKREIFVYKLSWKYDTDAAIADTALGYLLEGRFNSLSSSI